MEELLASVAQNGFSIAVAAYLLIRMESRVESLSQAIQELRLAIVESRVE
ncbi:YvrJ family protein [Dethiosulfovibrio salsuginis]|uniref:YvrJ protein family protein n=1 Tax=Dethiosulfovibrio salsuginis TaxID=561720 RepID=A0A1X7LEP5_9BACT|nr:YvrJ family protein [Dethiosulfovibrio salsuginis]MDD4836581.1 YvrJ family protein [Dethiosulfovibrio sp.]SMG52336.1 YvrJ protein family protein [Dethiosulfovibrio salsuginis]